MTKTNYFKVVSYHQKIVVSITDTVSPQQYLEQERLATSKHEYYKGEIIEMMGAGLNHCRIAVNLLAGVHNKIDRSYCEVFISDLRVTIPSMQFFGYPDIIILCNEPDLLDDHFDTLKNPSVIFEIVSPLTEYNDRGRKFFCYMQIPTLQEYILVDTTAYYIQIARKQEKGSWKFEDIKDEQAYLRINTILQQISLEEIYANVKF